MSNDIKVIVGKVIVGWGNGIIHKAIIKYDIGTRRSYQITCCGADSRISTFTPVPRDFDPNVYRHCKRCYKQ